MFVQSSAPYFSGYVSGPKPVFGSELRFSDPNFNESVQYVLDTLERRGVRKDDGMSMSISDERPKKRPGDHRWGITFTKNDNPGDLRGFLTVQIIEYGDAASITPPRLMAVSPDGREFSELNADARMVPADEYSRILAKRLILQFANHLELGRVVYPETVLRDPNADLSRLTGDEQDKSQVQFKNRELMAPYQAYLTPKPQ
jgi:hypothetical protein